MTKNQSSETSVIAEQQKNKHSKLPFVAIILVFLLVGSFIGNAITYSALDRRINDLESQLDYYQDGDYSSSGSNYI